MNDIENRRCDPIAVRAPRNLFRLDVAYALDPDPRGERGFIVSFSSGQAF